MAPKPSDYTPTSTSGVAPTSINTKRSSNSNMSGAVVTDTGEKVTTKGSPNTPTNIYNVNIGGKDYPTTDPNKFLEKHGEPTKPTDQQIEFLPNGRVRTTENGRTIEQTKEDYNRAQKERATRALTGKGEFAENAGTGGVDTSQLGQIDEVTGEQIPIDVSGKQKVSLLSKGATFGAVGGALGTAVLPGVGTAIGAGAGFAIGAITDLFSNVEADRLAIAKGTYSNFKASKSQMASLGQIVKSTPISNAEAIDAYNQNLQNIRQARANIFEVSKDLSGDKLAQAQADLTNIDIYLASEGLRRLQFANLLNDRKNAPLPTEGLSE